MSIRLNGSTSGYTEIDAPAVAGSNTLVLPTGNGTANQALVTDGSGTLSFADRGRMVLATAQNSTSGTSVDFTSIPSWVKKITVIFSGVSTNGTSNLLIQIGAGSITTSGYASSSGSIAAAAAASTAGFIQSQVIAAASLYCGTSQIFLVSGNTYTNSGLLSTTTANNNFISGGNITLSGTLDRVRITTVNGTDTFDAGSINILYEG